MTVLEVASMVVAWMIAAFLRSDGFYKCSCTVIDHSSLQD